VTYRLSAAAARDLRGIAAFGQRRYGEAQTRVYARLLVKAFGKLAQEPMLLGSKDMSHWRPGLRKIHLRRFQQGRRSAAHVIFYRSTEDGPLEIVRVLRDVMDFEAALDRRHEADDES
jgi:plasmid stabilization system protein ParE